MFFAPGNFGNKSRQEKSALNSGDEIAVGLSLFRLQAAEPRNSAGRTVEMHELVEHSLTVIGFLDKILVEDLPETLSDGAKAVDSAPAKYHRAVRNPKKQLIIGALDQSAGNITEAAKLLGVHANYLHRLMRNFDLRPPLKRQISA